mmetsp:Transcript_13488/g.37273  ORF Transcript_13488/g.37273 Transcript_13488/m.37273 type:complete len:118 (-) Transcript_13488:69-422(-)
MTMVSFLTNHCFSAAFLENRGKEGARKRDAPPAVDEAIDSDGSDYEAVEEEDDEESSLTEDDTMVSGADRSKSKTPPRPRGCKAGTTPSRRMMLLKKKATMALFFHGWPSMDLITCF